MTIDFTPVPSTKKIPRCLRVALTGLRPHERARALRWLDETPKADHCLMNYLEELHEQSQKKQPCATTTHE